MTDGASGWSRLMVAIPGCRTVRRHHWKGTEMRTLTRLALTTAALAAPTLADGATPQRPTTEWPSYNRTLTSERFSTLAQVDRRNAASLRVACTFDTGEVTAFQSGLVQVGRLLLATTEHDTIALDPETCVVRWRAHADFPNGFLGAQRGVAVADGRVFRGAGDGRVYAYDLSTGRLIWNVQIADAKRGESVPAAPIAWNGRLFIGTAGGDNKGVKGRMYALDAATGRVLWEFYMVPKSPGDRTRGPQAAGAPAQASWGNAPVASITGGGNWTSYSLDPATGTLYVPGGNPAPDFVRDMRTGDNLYSGSIVALDARTGAYRTHYLLSPNDFHDWDASSAPVIATSRRGRRLMVTAPKDGLLYGYDRDTGRRLYRVPLETRTNVDAPLGATPVRFCPGTQGGAEWNGPAFDPVRDVFFTGQVDWCATVRLDPDSEVRSVAAGQPWTGSSSDGFGTMDPPSLWKGWVVSTDAETGRRRWAYRADWPVLAAVTPTAGGVVMFGDMGGNFRVLDSDRGIQLWSHRFDGAMAGGVITYDTGAGQRVAVVSGMTSPIWPTPRVTAKIHVLALP